MSGPACDPYIDTVPAHSDRTREYHHVPAIIEGGRRPKAAYHNKSVSVRIRKWGGRMNHALTVFVLTTRLC